MRSSRKAPSAKSKLDHLSAEELVALIRNAEQALSRKREETRSKLLADMRLAAEKAGFDFNELVRENGADKRNKRSDAGVGLSAKYRGPNGETYEGRGRIPKWLKELERKGVNREKFRVKGQ